MPEYKKIILFGRRLRNIEIKNPSHARELFARKAAVPILIHVFGERLAGVLLVGSSQVGVRTATEKSDVDIVAVLKSRSLTDEELPRLENTAQEEIDKILSLSRCRFTADIIVRELWEYPPTQMEFHHLLTQRT